jgi:hypothetical protein
MVDGYEGGGACCLRLGICCWVAITMQWRKKKSTKQIFDFLVWFISVDTT